MKTKTIEQVVAALEAYHDPAEGWISVHWSVEDVKEMRPDLTYDQCDEVLGAVLNKHDANVGINWDVLRHHAQSLFGDEPEGDNDD